MNQLDRFYRALIDYRKQTVGNGECDRLRHAVARANEQDDFMSLERKKCTVETDWIDAIEKGLVHIEKAIKEERQFIRSNGEVLPIEKVKRVDKESVVHLARHSNLLTKAPKEGGDIIPDQLYTVERLSDYAVYENRFLYRLLCYLRDFITLRYDKILELTTTYNGKLSLNKTVDCRKQKIKLQINLSEQRKNDWYLKEHHEAKKNISRIDLILKAVIHYLNTPLMEEVAKAPMLKPPITKTNVLKMNQNFKGCMALYEYITAYNKPGYTVEDFRKTFNPFSEVVADEMAEAVSLLSFLTYEHSMGLENFLRESYQEEEVRRKAEEAEKLREQIRKLKKRIEESGMPPEEYMLMLEKRNRLLEADSAQLAVAKQDIERLTGEVTVLTETVGTLEVEVQTLKDEIVEINERHEREIAELHERYTRELEEQKSYYENALSEQKTRYETEIFEQRTRYETEIFEQKTRYETTISEMKEEYEATVSDLTERYTKEISDLVRNNEIDRQIFQQTVDETRTTYEKKEKELYDDLAAKVAQWEERIAQNEQAMALSKAVQEQESEQRRLAEGRMNAMRYEQGWIKDKSEFLTKASFDELEHQYRMLQQLFKQEWKKVKKDIRSRIVWSLFKRGSMDEEQATDEGAKPEVTTAMVNEATAMVTPETTPPEIMATVTPEAMTPETTAATTSETAAVDKMAAEAMEAEAMVFKMMFPKKAAVESAVETTQAQTETAVTAETVETTESKDGAEDTETIVETQQGNSVEEKESSSSEEPTDEQ